MTREETIRLLTEWAEQCRYEAIRKAVGLAVVALRAQQEPNPPLTLEGLREMDGEPLWVVAEDVNGFDPLIMCALVEVSEESVWLTNCFGGRSEYYFDRPIEKGITLYRRKPEKV